MIIRRAEPDEGIARVCAEGWRDTYSRIYEPERIESVIAEYYRPERIRSEIADHSRRRRDDCDDNRPARRGGRPRFSCRLP